MNEYVATLKKITYIKGFKTELIREVDILSANIQSAYKLAIKMNKGWSLDKKDIHEVVVGESDDE